MQNIKEHTGFKSITLIITVMLLTPSVVKFTHIFTHHTHEICKGYESTHVHKVDMDCDFYKFQLNNNFKHSFFNFDFLFQKKETNQIISQYQFVSKFQRLQTALRGPPALI